MYRAVYVLPPADPRFLIWSTQPDPWSFDGSSAGSTPRGRAARPAGQGGGVEGRGRRSLMEGQVVEFVLTEGEKGPQADEVAIIDKG